MSQFIQKSSFTSIYVSHDTNNGGSQNSFFLRFRKINFIFRNIFISFVNTGFLFLFSLNRSSYFLLFFLNLFLFLNVITRVLFTVSSILGIEISIPIIRNITAFLLFLFLYYYLFRFFFSFYEGLFGLFYYFLFLNFLSFFSFRFSLSLGFGSLHEFEISSGFF